MLKTESKTIGNSTYHVTQLPAKKGRQVLTRLIKRLGPVIGALLEGEGVAQVKSIMDIEGESLSRAFQELATRLQEDDLDYFCQVFGAHSQVEAEDAVLPLTLETQDMLFAGAYQDMFRWLAFALEVNFGGFFGAFPLGSGTNAEPDNVEKVGPQ